MLTHSLQVYIYITKIITLYIKDLCVARCVHTLESGNCTSWGDWDGCHLSMITKRFDPI